jgi:hypothetical protein
MRSVTFVRVSAIVRSGCKPTAYPDWVYADGRVQLTVVCGDASAPRGTVTALIARWPRPGPGQPVRSGSVALKIEVSVNLNPAVGSVGFVGFERDPACADARAPSRPVGSSSAG